MKKLALPILIILFFACTKQNHFINDTAYLKQVKSDFEQVKKLASNREKQLFDVFSSGLTLEEQEALMFLYAYMPLNDLADYDGEFFLNNVRLALKTRETFTWGNQIPEDIFRHFVLPYRVNNENLDTSRAVFFNELSTRLQGLTLKEAILEVNHWCHEKVNYQPTDERTISPLGAVKSTYGRCGEESTFTVTAMRAAGIPARQCYTPRWAHTDDNHAWVEVWVDGKWHYLGACEPEADLDIAWFSAPALRAMLVNSNVFGKYNGPEEIILKEEKYTKVNMLSNYAPVKTIFAKVVNQNKEIVPRATVEFQLYNYAEFYPIAKKEVDNNGIASLQTGFGDLLIWAYKGNDFAYQKITVEQTDTIILQLHPHEAKEYSETYDIVPPIAKEPKQVSADGAAQNQLRLAQEDSIRNAFAGTFMKKEEAEQLAAKYQFEPLMVWDFIEKSRGNYSEIADFISRAGEINADFTIALLQSIAPKDLRDGESDILISHIEHSFGYAGDLPNTNHELFTEYILNPRIANEKLIAYKNYLQQAFGEDFILKTKQDIHHLINWINTNITILDDVNYYNVPISSQGVYELKLADSYSRDLFFVAACRSFGIPSRLEPATKVPQYFNGEWTDINFGKKTLAENKQKGRLTLKNSNENNSDPKYRIHFALSKFDNGKYNTLDYGWETPLSQMDNTLLLEAGNYMLITGNRLKNGNVLSQLHFFTIVAGEEKAVEINLRKDSEKLQSLFECNKNQIFKNQEGKEIEIPNNQISVIGFLDPTKEPTKHTLLDIEKLKPNFDQLESNIYLFIQTNDAVQSKYNLPVSVEYLIDSDFKLLTDISTASKQPLNHLPVFLVVQNGNVYFLSEGYTIGIGEQLIKTIQQLK